MISVKLFHRHLLIFIKEKILNGFDNGFDNGMLNGMILIDLEKAFDTTGHEIFLNILKTYKKYCCILI